MNLLIIEGTDNIGKDTLKNQLIDLFDEVTVIHCSSPKQKCFTSYEQDSKFLNYAHNIANGVYNHSDCIIMNRSHYGEYVYGQIYRNRSPHSISNMINKVDDILLGCPDLNIKYIQLLSSSIELRKKNDDGKSLYYNDQQMELENKLFLDIYNSSKFNKKLIYVNNHTSFRPIKEIYNEALEFINS